MREEIEVLTRYVKANYDGSYSACEVGSDRRYDLRQWKVEDVSELPLDVRDKADKRLGYYPPYVEWPLPNPPTAAKYYHKERMK